MQEAQQPSTANIAVACAIIAGVTGYMLGQAKSLGLFGGSPISQAPAGKKEKADGSEEDAESSDDEDDSVPLEFPDHKEECKMVLVVRTDLGMTKGKIGAQCGHAVLACYKHFLRNAPNSPIMKRWEYMGQAKVALQVKSEGELELLQAQALSLGLVAHIIHDAGRTQIASGSATVLGIGPGPKGVIDQVTGHLKLL
ncbi:mitochondrial peptidyl-tRNA hydrolase-like protein Pth2 [Plenodomus tracheiphilus IPT5]|uniref:peptidyl-tRNA hydrolase n=1 Tax=Plenodomus tracheiphilus IPT5 TaxID=1408161 RepID=A0A6A7AY88_9PLEO|nr:mitochondrial peptidyl-tRNA hydrolase-like protein Pth2 [Plenodomus tracheiphilus IPT5]